jgi:rhizosphere induced protein
MWKVFLPTGTIASIIAFLIGFFIQNVASALATAKAEREANEKVMVVSQKANDQLNEFIVTSLRKISQADADLARLREMLANTEQRAARSQDNVERAEKMVKDLTVSAQVSSKFNSAENVVTELSQVLSTNATFLENIRKIPSIPVGSIVPFAGPDIPDKFRLCDGGSLERNSYSDLFKAIGASWGAIDQQHFSLPDLRGRFLRGVDQGSNRDPGDRSASGPAGNTTGLGSVQEDQTGPHKHGLSIEARHGPGHANGTAGFSSAENRSYLFPHYSTLDLDTKETRPKNAAVYWIIKVR